MITTRRPVAVDELEGHPFLKGLDRAFLDRLVEHSSERAYPFGATIALEGEPAHDFFLIVEGKVGLEIVAHDRPRLTILTLGPGEVFGWSWLVPPHRWRVDARAFKPTRVWVLPGRDLLRALDTHPAQAYPFLRRFIPVLAERLDATRLQVLDVHQP